MARVSARQSRTDRKCALGRERAPPTGKHGGLCRAPSDGALRLEVGLARMGKRSPQPCRCGFVELQGPHKPGSHLTDAATVLPSCARAPAVSRSSGVPRGRACRARYPGSPTRATAAGFAGRTRGSCETTAAQNPPPKALQRRLRSQRGTGGRGTKDPGEGRRQPGEVATVQRNPRRKGPRLSREWGLPLRAISCKKENCRKWHEGRSLFLMNFS